MGPVLIIQPGSSSSDVSESPKESLYTVSTSRCNLCGATDPLTRASTSWFNKGWSVFLVENGPTFQQLKESSVRCTLCCIFYKGLLACVPGICPSTIIGKAFNFGSGPGPRLVLETKAPRTQIEFFAVQGATAPCTNIGPGTWVSGDTGSEAAMQKIVNWLENCESTHSRCQPKVSSFFPTRVLDVGKTQGDKIKLYESSFWGRRGRYITLSHCWGDSQPLQTKLTTIQERRHDIPWFSLPRTFQDAIVITRRLGVQYIWIDSLCIVQDDGDDWRKEASNMCDVYQNAWLNLAATKSSHCHDGLFSRVPQKQISVIGHDCNFDVGARQLIQHSKLLPGEETTHFPLLGRAWVYQERLLARRVVHFGPQELFWECQGELACECSVISKPLFAYGETYLSPKIQHSIFFDENTLKEEVVSERWHRVVMEYSNLQPNLTRASDAFPALSGLAKQFYRYQHDEYLAGLWRTTLVKDMAWRVHKTKRSTRPKPWRAPSWSWASIDEPVEYIRQVEGFRRARGEAAPLNMPLVSVLDVHCIPAGHDSMGQLRSAHLKISGNVIPAYLGICEKQFKGQYYKLGDVYDGSFGLEVQTQEECDYFNREIDEKPDYEYFNGEEASKLLRSSWRGEGKYFVRVNGQVEKLADMDYRFFDDNTDVLMEERNVLCLKLTRVEFQEDGTINYDSLILRQRGEGMYERIGLVRAGDNWYSDCDSARSETITIV